MCLHMYARVYVCFYMFVCLYVFVCVRHIYKTNTRTHVHTYMHACILHTYINVYQVQRVYHTCISGSTCALHMYITHVYRVSHIDIILVYDTCISDLTATQRPGSSPTRRWCGHTLIAAFRYVYMCMYTHAHTHTHTHTHTRIYDSLSSLLALSPRFFSARFCDAFSSNLARLSLAFTHTHSHTHTHALSHTHSCS